MSQNEQLVNQIAGSLAMEGLALNAAEKQRLLECANGERQTEQLLAELVSQYRC